MKNLEDFIEYQRPCPWEKNMNLKSQGKIFLGWRRGVQKMEKADREGERECKRICQVIP